MSVVIIEADGVSIEDTPVLELYLVVSHLAWMVVEVPDAGDEFFRVFHLWRHRLQHRRVVAQIQQLGGNPPHSQEDLVVRDNLHLFVDDEDSVERRFNRGGTQHFGQSELPLHPSALGDVLIDPVRFDRATARIFDDEEPHGDEPDLAVGVYDAMLDLAAEMRIGCLDGQAHLAGNHGDIVRIHEAPCILVGGHLVAAHIFCRGTEDPIEAIVEGEEVGLNVVFPMRRASQRQRIRQLRFRLLAL